MYLDWALGAKIILPGRIIVAMGWGRCGGGMNPFGIDHNAATRLLNHLCQRWNNIQFDIRRGYRDFILHILDGRCYGQIPLSRM